MTFMPSAINLSRTMSDISSSSRIMMRGAISTTDTSLPSRPKACAISQPIGPPPKTISRFGCSSIPHNVSELYQLHCSRPSMGGTNGRAPVARMIFRAVIVCPFTSTAHGLTTLPSPIMQSTPRLVNRSTESCGSIFLMAACTRAITSLKSNSALAVFTPYFCE